MVFIMPAVPAKITLQITTVGTYRTEFIKHSLLTKQLKLFW